MCASNKKAVDPCWDLPPMGVPLTLAYGLGVIGWETRVFQMIVSSGTTSDAGWFMRGKKTLLPAIGRSMTVYVETLFSPAFSG